MNCSKEVVTILLGMVSERRVTVVVRCDDVTWVKRTLFVHERVSVYMYVGVCLGECF